MSVILSGSGVTLNGIGNSFGQDDISFPVIPASSKYIPIPGLWQGPGDLNAGFAGGHAHLQDRFAVYPFTPPCNIDIEKLGIRVQSAHGAEKVLKISIFELNEDRTQASLMIETGSIPCTASVGVSADVEFSFERGKSYLIGTRTNAAINFESFNSGHNLALGIADVGTSTSLDSLYRTLAYGTATPATINISDFTPTQGAGGAYAVHWLTT